MKMAMKLIRSKMIIILESELYNPNDKERTLYKMTDDKAERKGKIHLIIIQTSQPKTAGRVWIEVYTNHQNAID